MSTREFVTFKWKPPPGYRSKFGPETVNTLCSMLERHHRGPIRLTCITDDDRGIDSRIRCLPLWDDWAHLPSPHGVGYPSCYRRLKLFSQEARELIGERFVVLDLDVVITADITPLFDGDWEFKIWGDTAKGTPYNGSLWQLQAGTRSKVWEQFDPERSPKRSLALGYIGSDQGWIAAALGPNERKWSHRDGVYSYRNHIQRQGFLLPANARLVIFHGAVDPWSEQAQRLSWVRKHYR
jgi:hypothetical protein